MLWYVLERYVHCLLGNSHLALPPEEEAARAANRPREQIHLTMQVGNAVLILYPGASL